jgi:hypothetical protein
MDKHASGLARTLLAVAVCAGGACRAQTAPEWASRTISDKDVGDYVELELHGVYVRPPSVVSAEPVLVIDCASGKVLKNYFSFGAVLSHHAGGNFPVELEAFVDNVRRPIGVQDMSPDYTAAYFPRRELRRMLVAKKVLVGAVEFAGPQMQASFTMPDPAPVFEACGKDRFLQQR